MSAISGPVTSPHQLSLSPPRTLSPPSPCHPDLVLSALHSCYLFSAQHPLLVSLFLSLLLPTTSSTQSPFPPSYSRLFPCTPSPSLPPVPSRPQHPKYPLPVSALAPPLTSGSAGFRGGGPRPRLGPVRSLPAPPPALPLDSPFFFTPTYKMVNGPATAGAASQSAATTPLTGAILDQ